MRSHPHPLFFIVYLRQSTLHLGCGNCFTENRRIGTFRHTSHAADTFLPIERGNLRGDVAKIPQRSRPWRNQAASDAHIRRQRRRSFTFLISTDDAAVEVVYVTVEVELYQIRFGKRRFVSFHGGAGLLNTGYCRSVVNLSFQRIENGFFISHDQNSWSLFPTCFARSVTDKMPTGGLWLPTVSTTTKR